MTNTNTAARNFTSFAKIATKVTIDELQVMLNEDNNPDIYEARKPRKIAMSAHIWKRHATGAASVSFNYNNRNGYNVEQVVRVGSPIDSVIFVFNNGNVVAA
jgi:hypothetical protein